MKAGRNILKNLCLTGVILFLFFLGIRCSSPQQEGATGEAKKKVEFPDQESWGSTVTITQQGRKVAEVWAGYIALYNKKNITVLKDSIHVDFYNREGKHMSVLTADSGFVYNRTNDLEARGHVVVVSDSGVVLETEVLRWDNRNQKIVSDVPVRFTTAEDTLIGDSFVSDPDLRNYELRNARGYSRRKIPMEK